MYLFLILFAAVFGTMMLYTWKRFVCKLALLPLIKQSFAFILLAIFIFSIFYLVAKRFELISDRLLDIFAIAIGMGFVFFALAVLYDLASLLALPRGKSWGFYVAIDLIFIVVANGYIIYALVEASKDPTIRHIEIESKRIGSDLKIVHLTDLHFGNNHRLNEKFARHIADQVELISPDLVAITGDMIDAPLDKVKRSLEIIATIKQPLYFVLGNHEYFYETEEIIAYTKELGFKVLENSHEVIAHGTDWLTIAGLYDAVGRKMSKYEPDAKQALMGADQDRFTVVLSHQPKLIRDFEAESFDLFLSGHTHAGQIFPFGLLVKLDQPYLYGLYKHDERGSIYVSSGAGFWGPPLRSFVPSEIAVLSIKAVK